MVGLCSLSAAAISVNASAVHTMMSVPIARAMTSGRYERHVSRRPNSGPSRERPRSHRASRPTPDRTLSMRGGKNVSVVLQSARNTAPKHNSAITFARLLRHGSRCLPPAEIALGHLVSPRLGGRRRSGAAPRPFAPRPDLQPRRGRKSKLLSLGGCDPRQLDAERRAQAGLAVHLDRPAVQLDERLREREADAHAAIGPRRGPVDLAEALEDEGQVVRVDADAIAGDREGDAAVVGPGLDADLAAFRRELHRGKKTMFFSRLRALRSTFESLGADATSFCSTRERVSGSQRQIQAFVAPTSAAICRV